MANGMAQTSRPRGGKTGYSPIARGPAAIIPQTVPKTFGFSIVALVIGIIIAIFIPYPTPFQRTIFAVVVSLAGTSITASSVSGFIQINSKWLKAGGPVAVFVFLCFFIIKFSEPENLNSNVNGPAEHHRGGR
jgi:hypothetical protein